MTFIATFEECFKAFHGSLFQGVKRGLVGLEGVATTWVWEGAVGEME